MTLNTKIGLAPRTIVAAGLALLLLPQLASATRCLVPQLPRPQQDYKVTMDALKSEGLWEPGLNPDRSPPADPQLGDTWLWYIWNLAGYPTATLKPCTVRGMGDDVYVVVDDQQWNVQIDQADVDRIVDYFENQSLGPFPDQGIWDLDTGNFGDPPNPLDGLHRIFLLYYRFNISADGFFWVYDQYPDGSQPFASNEADVVYLATDSGNPSSNYMLGVAAHEFQHLIHFNYDTNEDTWANEGLSELAMWLFGNPDVISSFNGNPDNSLTSWGSAWADYIQTYLWTLYIYEQYGGQPVIWDVVHNPANGMTGYQQTLDGHGYNISMQDVFRDWGGANYLDDTSIPDGQYGYAGEALPPFAPWRTHTTYPATASGSVQNWATDYIRLVTFTGVPTLDFNGQDGRAFRVLMMARKTGSPTLVHEVLLDSASDGSYAFSEALGYDEVIVSVANVFASATSSYTYTVGNVVTDVPETGGKALALHSYPNPFNPACQIQYSLPAEGPVRVDIYDLQGKLVRRLVDQRQGAGDRTITWDGRDDQGRTMNSGAYLCRIEAGGSTARQTLMLVK